MKEIMAGTKEGKKHNLLEEVKMTLKNDEMMQCPK
jgi:hypothetical protein